MSFRIRASDFNCVEVARKIFLWSLVLVSICGSRGNTFANEWEANVEFETTGYIGNPVNRPSREIDSLLDGHVRGKFGTSLQAVIDLDAGADLSGRGDHYISPSEFYFGTEQERWSLHFGRKELEYSKADEFWKSGLWQPRFRRDFFHPQTEGLSGFFSEYEVNEKWTVAVMATPFFIPERGPTFDLVDGQFQSASPFWDVQSGFQIFGEPTEIRYRLNEPKMKDVLINPGATISARFQESPRGEGVWGQFAYGYKPMNQLRLAYIPEINTPNVSGEIELTPEVVYHHLASLEAGYRLNRYSGWISLTSEIPESPELPNRGNVQDFSSAHTLSTFLNWNLSGEGRRRTEISLGYLHLFGGKTQDVGDLEIEGGSVFEPRYSFYDAFSLGFQTPLPMVSQVIAKTRFVHDITIDASLLSAGIEFKGKEGWSLGVSADIAGVGKRNSSSVTRGKDFISRFQGNDRIRGGVSYVF